MTLSPQTYIDSTLAEALAAGCDLVQLKVRGIWVRVEISRGIARVYDRNGEDTDGFEVQDKDACCTLIGDYVPKVKQIFVWDCWAICMQHVENLRLTENNTEEFPYRDRYAFARLELTRMPMERLSLIRNYRIDGARVLWTDFVVPGEAELNCGLVFRRSKDPVSGVLRVARKYKEIPGDLP